MSKPRSLASDEFNIAANWFKTLVQLGTVDPLSSSLAVPFHMVFKDNEDW